MTSSSSRHSFFELRHDEAIQGVICGEPGRLQLGNVTGEIVMMSTMPFKLITEERQAFLSNSAIRSSCHSKRKVESSQKSKQLTTTFYWPGRPGTLPIDRDLQGETGQG